MDNQNPQTPAPLAPPSKDPKQQITERLQQANNVLVTVSTNPSVDQLAACIGLTLILNKLNKHATAVFSGKVPSTIEFLQPEQTLEKNTDSLRDFIIALDKAKADKLRYKVEDRVVKIFITPYRTSIGEKDLEFSQGDFNVDVVVALGVHEQADLDQAIVAHGRILHDAVVTTISTAAPSTLGTINWQDASASSLSELITTLGDSIGPNLLDGQIATALLTGIVAETDRFSNNKTSPRTMSASAALMSAGANQQLVATKLEPPPPPPEPPAAAPPPKPEPSTPPPPKSPDGTLEVTHDKDGARPSADGALGSEDDETADWLLEQQQIHIDDEGMLHRLSGDDQTNSSSATPTSTPPTPVTAPPEPPLTVRRETVIEPPTHGGTLTANTEQEKLDPSLADLSLPKVEQPILDHIGGSTVPSTPTTGLTPPPIQDETLEQIEKLTDSPHIQEHDSQPSPVLSTSPAQTTALDLESVRGAVQEAVSTDTPPVKPEALGSLYAFDNLHAEPSPLPPGSLAPLQGQPRVIDPPLTQISPTVPNTLSSEQAPATSIPLSPFPPSLVPPTASPPQPITDAPNNAPSSPPPLPPPFQFGSPPASGS